MCFSALQRVATGGPWQPCAFARIKGGTCGRAVGRVVAAPVRTYRTSGDKRVPWMQHSYFSKLAYQPTCTSFVSQQHCAWRYCFMKEWQQR
jgi:hypothetical protein